MRKITPAFISLFGLWFGLCYFQFSYAQKIFINEVMASNTLTVRDPDYNAYSDWIEIFNSADSTVNLNGYFITDDMSNIRKYKISSDLIIRPGGYALIWADDAGSANHANFKLSASGETIGLYDSSGVLIDSVTFGEQLQDISYGRFPDGGADLARFTPATPGKPNEESGIIDSKLSEAAFSLPGGFYNGPVTLTLSHPETGASVRYTTNGSVPTINSPAYASPIKLDSTTAVSVRVFKNGFSPSNVSVNTYFINFQAELPVFSIVTDSVNFFSDTIGIYVAGTKGITGHCSTVPRNWNQEWERPVNIEFYEKDKSPAFNHKAGIKIYGGCTRLYDMKSLALYFRKSYGPEKLHCRLFPDYPIAEFNNFLLKSSGQDWWRTMFRDGMIHTLVKQGMNVDYLEYRPSIVFINGKYWGIHNIGEKINEHYLKSRFGVNPDSIDIIVPGTTGVADQGDLKAYHSLMNFYSTKNLALPENYAYMKSIVDIDEYIDYFIAEIYAANGDWPAGNMKMWKERSPSGKWRWLLYDTDFGFGGNPDGQYSTNTLEQATAANSTKRVSPPWATLMLRKMLENSEFKNEFIQRFAVHMSTTFEKDHVLRVIDSLGSRIASEIPRHKARWPKSITIEKDNTWLQNVQIMKDFAVYRQANVRNHFYSKFSIPGAYSMTLSRSNPEWGKIIAHTVEIKNNGEVLVLFKNIPFKANAVAMPGYRFVKWEGASGSTSPGIELNPSVNSQLTAVFEPDSVTSGTIVINEINYKSASSFDTDDWIELYNSSAGDINISGWKLQNKKSADAFSFPGNTIIAPHGYLVVCRDSIKFDSLQVNKLSKMGNIGFGLDSQGDMIKLIDNNGKIIDSVSYGVTGEWPSSPCGMGPALALINPQLDNSLPKNWKPSALYGTPGRLNDTYTTGAEEEKMSKHPDFYLFDNYPNPFNNSTVISFSIPERSMVSLKVFDILGREILSLVNEEKDAGSYNVPFSIDAVSGIYIYVLQAGRNIQSKKMVLLK